MANERGPCAQIEIPGPIGRGTTKTEREENVHVDEILEQLIPLYDKNFTEDQLKAFITFYSSPDGKKLLDTIPILMRDSVDISAKYFEEKFPEEKAAADKAESENAELPAEPVSSNTATP